LIINDRIFLSPQNVVPYVSIFSLDFSIPMLYYSLMFLRVKKGGNERFPHDYLQIVESYRDGKTVSQRVIANLGRLDLLKGGGQIDSLVRSFARFSEHLSVIEKLPDVRSCESFVWGAVVVFERLWQRQGLGEIIRALARDRRFRFDVERVAFTLALHRLLAPGSDLACSRWLAHVAGEGMREIKLEHLYRTVGFLSEVRAELERELFLRDRDLFSGPLDLVFLDTTSTYCYRDEETPLRKRGHSMDHRSDLPQIVVAVVVDRKGWPLSWKVMPGNTHDAKAFRTVVAKLRERFEIGRVVVVCDRGMVSEENLSLLSDHKDSPMDYIVGCRMRKVKEVMTEVLSRRGRYHEVGENLKVKEFFVGERRYVVCMNEEEAKKDRVAREAIVADLMEKLEKRGAKSLIPNRGYARYLVAEKGTVRINFDAVREDERFDGKFVVRTTTNLPAHEVALAYKSLWRVERVFRETKSNLEVRPIFHHIDSQCVGHIIASFLALRLQIHLERALEDKGVQLPWAEVIGELKEVRAVNLTLEGRNYRIRTDVKGPALLAFQAAGVRVPPRVASLDE
jgi:hypothetical protein